jgi:glycosyltransferase involved in cell wall biosynthesis
MEDFFRRHEVNLKVNLIKDVRPKLAYVSPLLPDQSGIANYSADLLPFLNKHYKIEVIVPDGVSDDEWVKKNCTVRSVVWFKKHCAQYERVLYHFGNSMFHSHMFDLLKNIPGIVVLHDFYLSGVLENMDSSNLVPNIWTKALYYSHGYKAFAERFKEKNINQIINKYPISLEVIQDAVGVIAHSENALKLAKDWYKNNISDWEIIPLLRNTKISGSRKVARENLGIKKNDFVICSFGFLAPSKYSLILIEAYLKSKLIHNENCHLIFVGNNITGEYGDKLISTIAKSGYSKRIKITGWIDNKIYKSYLLASDLGVQLRTLSRGETSGAILDCLNYGIPSIINANGSMAEIPDHITLKLPNEFSERQLIEALEKMHDDVKFRTQLGINARNFILDFHDPIKCANRYAISIENFYHKFSSQSIPLANKIGRSSLEDKNRGDFMYVAQVIAKNFTQRNKTPQIFIDISKLINFNNRSNIQAVIISVLNYWLMNPPKGYRIEPVYANTATIGFKYARRYTAAFLNCPDDILGSDVDIEYVKDDIFISLDQTYALANAQQVFYKKLRLHDIKLKFFIYDNLPSKLPELSVLQEKKFQENWMNLVAEVGGSLYILKGEANDIKILIP